MSTSDKKKEIKKKQSSIYVGKGGKGTDILTSLSDLSKGKSPFAKASKQVQKEVYGTGGLVSYPYAPDNFLVLYESNPVFSGCVKQIARDVAGLGWKLILKEGAEENEEEKKKIQEFLDRPNPEESLRSLLNKLIIDWGVVGWWGLEVLRNGMHEVTEIYHTAAHSFKIHKKRKKFFQRRGMKEVWFKAFGEEDNISAKDGKKGTYDLKTRASELIYYKNYYPRSDFYGAPNILSALGAVIALTEIRDFNLSFFENYGVPAWLIVLKGNWPDDAPKTLTNFLDNTIKGSKNAKKTIVMNIQEGDSMDSKKLSEGTQEASFLPYIQMLIDDILMSYSMPGYRLGLNIVGKLGGSNIRESTEIYKNGVVEPLQNDIEDIVNHKLIEEGLNCNSYMFKLNDLDIRDIDAEVKRYVRLFNMGSITANQIRNLLNLGESYSEGDRYFVSSNIVESGEESIEKRQDKFIKSMEELKEGIGKLIRGEFDTEEEKEEFKKKIGDYEKK